MVGYYKIEARGAIFVGKFRMCSVNGICKERFARSIWIDQHEVATRPTTCSNDDPTNGFNPTAEGRARPLWNSLRPCINGRHTPSDLIIRSVGCHSSSSNSFAFFLQSPLRTCLQQWHWQLLHPPLLQRSNWLVLQQAHHVTLSLMLLL